MGFSVLLNLEVHHFLNQSDELLRGHNINDMPAPELALPGADFSRVREQEARHRRADIPVDIPVRSKLSGPKVVRQ